VKFLRKHKSSGKISFQSVVSSVVSHYVYTFVVVFPAVRTVSSLLDISCFYRFLLGFAQDLARAGCYIRRKA
jgi:hypothetical protein